jgi:hypothetical protein
MRQASPELPCSYADLDPPAAREANLLGCQLRPTVITTSAMRSLPIFPRRSLPSGSSIIVAIIPLGISTLDDAAGAMPHFPASEPAWKMERYDLAYSTITQSLLLRPKTSGEYISSALAGGTTNIPGVVARATYEYW